MTKVRVHIGTKVIRDLRANPSVIIRMLRRILITKRLYPTGHHGINRFIGGGMSEAALRWALRELTYHITDVSHLNRVDINVEFEGFEGVPFSVKYSCSNASIILQNYHGKKSDKVEPIHPSIFILVDLEKSNATILFLTQGLVDASEYTGTRITQNDANVSFPRPFINHLVKKLGDDFCLTVPLPTDIPVVTQVDIFEELILPDADRRLAEYDAQRALQH